MTTTTMKTKADRHGEARGLLLDSPYSWRLSASEASISTDIDGVYVSVSKRPNGRPHRFRIDGELPGLNTREAR